MFVKLDPGVNFINVLCTRFSYKILVPKITKLCFLFEIFGAKILYKNACVKCWWNWLQVKAGILTIRQSASHKRAIMTFSSPLPNHHHNFFVLPLFLRRPPFPTSFKGRPNTNESFRRGFGWKFGGSSQFLDSGLRIKKNQIYRVNFTNLVAQRKWASSHCFAPFSFTNKTMPNFTS